MEGGTVRHDLCAMRGCPALLRMRCNVLSHSRSRIARLHMICRAFGVSFGVYCIIAIVVFCFFGIARRTKLFKKYYAPKR